VKYNILWLKVVFYNFIIFFGFFSKISVLEVEIGKNGPGILGVNGLLPSLLEESLQDSLNPTFVI
jgi:hypothetical protein